MSGERPATGSARAAELIVELGLVPHFEGGHYREVYRSADPVARDGRQWAALTSIYFLLAAGERSRWHVVDLDEVWSFHEGDPLELLAFDPAAGRLQRLLLGCAGQGTRPQQVVPRGWWQAARPLGAYTLVGCAVAPGFERERFRFVAELPGHQAPFAGPLAGLADLL